VNTNNSNKDKFKPKAKVNVKYNKSSINYKSNNSNKSVNMKKPFQLICRLCGEEGHVMLDCPKRERAQAFLRGESVTHATVSNELDFDGYISATTVIGTGSVATLSTSILSSVLGRNDILLDCQSQGHLFGNKDLVTNIRPSRVPMKFAGVGGPMTVTKVAFFPPLGINVAFHEESPVNLLSFGKVHKKVGRDNVGYEKESDCFFFIGVDGIKRTFSNRGDLYVYTYVSDTTVLTTVTENEKVYSKREVDKAKEARELERRLGFPSATRVIDAINTGAIIGVSSTAHDFARAYKIWGQSTAMLQGKTRNQKPLPGRIEFLPKVVGTCTAILCMSVDKCSSYQ
jgi:hypothetical protein